MSGRTVIADTSPLQYLFQVGCLDLLSELFGQVLVPGGVAHELAEGRMRGFLVPDPELYEWVEVRSVDAGSLPADTAHLHLGEREALALALRAPDSLVILDDGEARRHAKYLGVRVTGTLGVLVAAKDAGLISAVSPLLDRLDALGFRLGADVRGSTLRLAGE